MNAIEQVGIYFAFLWRIFISFGKKEIWWRSKVEEEKDFVYQLKRFISLWGTQMTRFSKQDDESKNMHY
jgi:hypothetical protein